MFWHSRCIIICDAWPPAPLPESPPQPEPVASWFMQVESLKQQLLLLWQLRWHNGLLCMTVPVDSTCWGSVREYIPTVPKKHISQWFSWRLECWNSCYSLRILESCTEPGHLANGNAVHNPHVSITYELQQRQMTLI